MDFVKAKRNWQRIGNQNNFMSKLTDKQLNAKPTASDKWLSETVIWGHGSLVARITPRGERLFYFRYQNSQSDRIIIPIGAYDRKGENGTFTLSFARRRATELANLHLSGIKDIKEHLDHQLKIEQSKIESKRQAQKEKVRLKSLKKTVNDLFDHWEKIDLVKRKDHGTEVRRMFEKDVLPVIGSHQVDDVRKHHITQITDRILSRGSSRMANVVFSCLRQMFLFAVDRDWCPNDPTSSIRKSKIGSRGKIRERVLSPQEIQSLFEILPHSNLLLTSQIALWICLSTCCRTGEIMTAKWSDLDLNSCKWKITDTKNGKPITVHLSDFSKTKFLELLNHTGWSQWCFPNTSNSGPVNKKSISKQVGDRQLTDSHKRLTGRSQLTSSLKLPDGRWTPHDLRRTGATLMVANGVLPEVADRCLNHIEENRIKRTYLQHDYKLEMKEAWTILGRVISEIILLRTNNEGNP